MDIIVKHFSKGVIAATGFLFLFSLLFQIPFLSDKIGLLSALGNEWTVDQTTMQRQPVLATFQEQGSLKMPTIEYKKSQPKMETQQEIDMNQYFTAWNYENQKIAFTVEAIYNMQNQKEETSYNVQTQKLYFQKSGIYQIVLKTKDSTNRTCTYRFYIPVERKRVE